MGGGPAAVVGSPVGLYVGPVGKDVGAYVGDVGCADAAAARRATRARARTTPRAGVAAVLAAARRGRLMMYCGWLGDGWSGARNGNVGKNGAAGYSYRRRKNRTDEKRGSSLAELLKLTRICEISSGI